MGMVAFLRSGSGTNVASRIGPTIAGMNLIFSGPGSDTYIQWCPKIAEMFFSVFICNMYFALAIKDKQYSSDFTLYKKQFEQKDKKS